MQKIDSFTQKYTPIKYLELREEAKDMAKKHVKMFSKPNFKMTFKRALVNTKLLDKSFCDENYTKAYIVINNQEKIVSIYCYKTSRWAQLSTISKILIAICAIPLFFGAAYILWKVTSELIFPLIYILLLVCFGLPLQIFLNIDLFGIGLSGPPTLGFWNIVSYIVAQIVILYVIIEFLLITYYFLFKKEK